METAINKYERLFASPQYARAQVGAQVKDKLIMIGLPSSGSIRDGTVESVFNTQREGFLFPTILKIRNGPYIDHNQMKLVEEAREHKATHLMLIETDNVFSPWAIEQLVEQDKMVIGASYNFKTLTPPECKKEGVAPLVKLWNEDGSPRNITTEELPLSIFKCYSIPLGFVLINMSVFDLIEHPYFINIWRGTVFTGADVHFCEKVRAAGIDVWCDPTIKVGHVGSYVY